LRTEAVQENRPPSFRATPRAVGARHPPPGTRRALAETVGRGLRERQQSEPVGEPAGAGQLGIAQRTSSSVSNEPGLNRNGGLYRTFRCAPRVRQRGGARVSG